MKKSRKVPGKLIEWKDFFKLDLVGRDVRFLKEKKDEQPMLFRGPIDKRFIGHIHTELRIPVKWLAEMHLDGPKAGLWKFTKSRTLVGFVIGSRPRLMPNGRILIYRHATLQIDILPVGDKLNRNKARG